MCDAGVMCNEGGGLANWHGKPVHLSSCSRASALHLLLLPPFLPSPFHHSSPLHFPQAKDSAFDVGAWETYGDHWRYFFDCMLAPMATQAQSALDKLPVTATPRASIDTPSKFITSVMNSWTSMVAEITRGSVEAKPKAATAVVPARLFAYALAPQHGPVIRTSLSQLAAEYRKWTDEQV